MQKKRELRWMRLDNAAKIYPAAKRREWSNIFRLSATLYEKVDRDILQSALDKVVLRFPSIAVRVKAGMFWYYLEEVPKAPQIRSERGWPLAIMPFDDIKKCAFRVICHENRIAVEFFHALTDGNGGLIFLKTLVAQYLREKEGVTIPCTHGILDIHEAARDEELEDSFLKYCGDVSLGRGESNAYKLNGEHEVGGFKNLTTGIIPVDEVHKLAKSCNVSVTAYMVGAMMKSIMEIQGREQPNIKKQKPVKILIPTNLRKIFPSSTLRNFVLYVTPEIDPRMGIYSVEEIAKNVYHQMGVMITEKQMRAKITTNVKTEQSKILKVMPLFIKNIAMKAVYDIVGERKSCLSFSNLGVVEVPDEMRRFIERFDFILGTQATLHNNCGVISYNGNIYVNMIRNIKEADLERKFFTSLVKKGVHVKIESNQRT